MKFKYIFVALLLAIGFFGVVLKLSKEKHVIPSPYNQTEILTEYLNDRHLILTETFSLNREKTVIAYAYRYKDCDGGQIISPMLRNSEAVTLFARLTKYQNHKVGSVSYFLANKLYKSFPDLDFWIFQKISAAKDMIGFTHHSLAPVFAIRHFGQCSHENI